MSSPTGPSARHVPESATPPDRYTENLDLPSVTSLAGLEDALRPLVTEYVVADDETRWMLAERGAEAGLLGSLVFCILLVQEHPHEQRIGAKIDLLSKEAWAGLDELVLELGARDDAFAALSILGEELVFEAQALLVRFLHSDLTDEQALDEYRLITSALSGSVLYVDDIDVLLDAVQLPGLISGLATHSLMVRLQGDDLFAVMIDLPPQVDPSVWLYALEALAPSQRQQLVALYGG